MSRNHVWDRTVWVCIVFFIVQNCRVWISVIVTSNRDCNIFLMLLYFFSSCNDVVYFADVTLVSAKYVPVIYSDGVWSWSDDINYLALFCPLSHALILDSHSLILGDSIWCCLSGYLLVVEAFRVGSFLQDGTVCRWRILLWSW